MATKTKGENSKFLWLGGVVVVVLGLLLVGVYGDKLKSQVMPGGSGQSPTSGGGTNPPTGSTTCSTPEQKTAAELALRNSLFYRQEILNPIIEGIDRDISNLQTEIANRCTIDPRLVPPGRAAECRALQERLAAAQAERAKKLKSYMESFMGDLVHINIKNAPPC